MPKFIALAVLGCAIVAGIAPAVADTSDAQFLGIVRSNGIPGQDDTLISYAHEYCGADPTAWTFLPSAPALQAQGVGLGGFYVIRVAATQAYCPGKIAIPPQVPRVITGL